MRTGSDEGKHQVDFGSTYRPPGAYIQEDPTPLVSVVGVTPTVVALVGPAVGYRTNTEALTLTGTDAVLLSHLGIDPTNGFVVADEFGNAYDAADYVTNVGAGADGNVVTTVDNTLTVARSATSVIPDGGVVYVTYRYTDADYHAAYDIDDFDDVKIAYGDPFNPDTGAITSPLSLAAKIALENGARKLVMVATTGTALTATRAELAAAYDKLKTRWDVNVIVPITSGITGQPGQTGDTDGVANDLKNAILTATQEAVYRTAVLGFDPGVTVDPAALAAGVNSERVMLAYPWRLNYFNGLRNQTIEVGGEYLAAAYAGLLAALPVQTPLTRKFPKGFAGFPTAQQDRMTTSFKNSLSDGGVAVSEVDRQNRLVVRHGVSTRRDTIYTREFSLVRAKDALVNLIKDTIDRSDLIGTTIDLDTPMRIKGVMAGCLEAAVNYDVIVAYTDLKVRQQSVDPSVIDVKFQYIPAYPLNYILVTFSVNVATGADTLNAVTAA